MSDGIRLLATVAVAVALAACGAAGESRPGVAPGLASGLAPGAAMAPASPARFASSETVHPDRPGHETTRNGDSLTVGRSVFGRFLAARHAEAIGDYGTAADLLGDIVDAVPGEAAALRRLHRLAATEGRIDVARDHAARILAGDAEAPLAPLTLAVAALANGQPAAATGRLRAAGRDGINRLVVPLLLAWSIAATGDTDQALAALSDVLDTPSFSRIAGFHRGLIADLAGRTDIAAAGLRAATVSDDGAPLRAVMAYASFLGRQGRWAEATDLLSEFEADQPRSIVLDSFIRRIAARQAPARLVDTHAAGAAEALDAVARSLSQDGNRATALFLTRLAVHLNPEAPESRLLLGRILEDLERNGDALAVYRQIDPATPHGWLARLGKAEILGRTDRLDEAASILETMLAERPDRTDAAQLLGDLLRIGERFDDAILAYDQAVARAGDLTGRHWRLLYTRGIALERTRQWERAEADFLAALDLAPDHPMVLNYLAYSWVEQGMHLDRARRMLRKAVDQRPRDGFIVDSMGWVLYRLGDIDQAVTYLERAVLLQPGDPVINDHLGDAYWHAGRRREARFQWRRALDSNPDEKDIPRLQAKLSGATEPPLAAVGPAAGQDEQDQP